jgi:hypothetical protein
MMWSVRRRASPSRFQGGKGFDHRQRPRGAWRQRDVKTLKRFQVTLDGGLCKKCNNERLADLEQVL